MYEQSFCDVTQMKDSTYLRLDKHLFRSQSCITPPWIAAPMFRCSSDWHLLLESKKCRVPYFPEYKLYPYLWPAKLVVVWFLYLMRRSGTLNTNWPETLMAMHTQFWRVCACVKSMMPCFSCIRSISHMSKISSKFLNKKCDLYSEKNGFLHYSSHQACANE